MATLLELAKKLNKSYDSDTFLRKSDTIPTYRRLKSKALGFSYPLFGGLPYGRICTFSGKSHSGKTTAAMACIADYQRENPDKTCVFVDVEHAIDLQFQVLMHGIDQEKLFIVDPPVGMSGEQILATILELQLNSDDIGMIVIDSVAALDTAQNLESDFTEDKGMRATIAGFLHKFCKEITASLSEKGNILIAINQVRVAGKTRQGAPIYSEPGGSALNFNNSVSIRFGTRSFMKGDDELKGEDGEGADGFRIKYKVTKNRTANTTRGGGFITYRYSTGMDWLSDMLQIAISFDYIHRVNNVTYEIVDLETGEVMVDEEGNQLRGKKQKLVEYIIDHKDFRDRYIDMLYRCISESNTKGIDLIDKETSSEINEECVAVGEDE